MPEELILVLHTTKWFLKLTTQSNFFCQIQVIITNQYPSQSKKMNYFVKNTFVCSVFDAFFLKVVFSYTLKHSIVSIICLTEL